MASTKAKSNGKFPLTKVREGYWRKIFRGKRYHFTGTKAEALRQWKRLEAEIRSALRQVPMGESYQSFSKLSEIHPSPDNAQLYRPVLETDPEAIALAKKIKRDGLLERIVTDSDGWIISGHRRYAACKLAGLTSVPVLIRYDVSRETDTDEFVKLLREYNRQREKSNAECLREELIDVNPDLAHHGKIGTARRERQSPSPMPPKLSWRSKSRRRPIGLCQNRA